MSGECWDKDSHEYCALIIIFFILRFAISAALLSLFCFRTYLRRPFCINLLAFQRAVSAHFVVIGSALLQVFRVLQRLSS